MTERVKRLTCIQVRHFNGTEHEGACTDQCQGPIVEIDAGCACPDAPHGECSALIRTVERLYAEVS